MTGITVHPNSIMMIINCVSMSPMYMSALIILLAYKSDIVATWGSTKVDLTQKSGIIPDRCLEKDVTYKWHFNRKVSGNTALLINVTKFNLEDTDILVVAEQHIWSTACFMIPERDGNYCLKPVYSGCKYLDISFENASIAFHTNDALHPNGRFQVIYSFIQCNGDTQVEPVVPTSYPTSEYCSERFKQNNLTVNTATLVYLTKDTTTGETAYVHEDYTYLVMILSIIFALFLTLILVLVVCRLLRRRRISTDQTPRTRNMFENESIRVPPNISPRNNDTDNRFTTFLAGEPTQSTAARSRSSQSPINSPFYDRVYDENDNQSRAYLRGSNQSDFKSLIEEGYENLPTRRSFDFRLDYQNVALDIESTIIENCTVDSGNDMADGPDYLDMSGNRIKYLDMSGNRNNRMDLTRSIV